MADSNGTFTIFELQLFSFLDEDDLPVRHCFKDNGFVVLQDILASQFGRIIHGEYVGTIDANDRNTIARTTTGYSIAFVLLSRWC